MTAQQEHSQCPLVEMISITSMFIDYTHDSSTGTFTVTPSGGSFYYFSVYCLQIWQHNRNIHSAPLWKQFLLLLCLLFTDMTAQQKHLQCPLVEAVSFTSLFIVYRYDSTTGTFTVPPGGDGYYYFSIHFLVRLAKWARFDVAINGEILCSTEQSHGPRNYGQAVCSGASYITGGILTYCNAIFQIKETKSQTSDNTLFSNITRDFTQENRCMILYRHDWRFSKNPTFCNKRNTFYAHSPCILWFVNVFPCNHQVTQQRLFTTGEPTRLRCMRVQITITTDSQDSGSDDFRKRNPFS